MDHSIDYKKKYLKYKAKYLELKNSLAGRGRCTDKSTGIQCSCDKYKESKPNKQGRVYCLNCSHSKH